MAVEEVPDVLAHAELGHGNEVDPGTRAAGQKIGERPHGAAEAAIAHEGDLDVVRPAEFALDRIEVEHRLGRVLFGARARVEHRHVEPEPLHVAVDHEGRVLVVVAQNQGLRPIARDDARGVFQHLALGRGGELARILGIDHLGAEADGRELERHTGAGGGLVEQHHHDLVAEDRLGLAVEQPRRAIGQFGEDIGREDLGFEDGLSLERHGGSSRLIDGPLICHAEGAKDNVARRPSRVVNLFHRLKGGG